MALTRKPLRGLADASGRAGCTGRKSRPKMQRKRVNAAKGRCQPAEGEVVRLGDASQMG